MVSQHALQVSRPTPRGEVEGSGLGGRGGGYPGPHPGGKLRCLAWGGGSLGPHPGGKLRGLAWEGVSRPTPGFFFHKSYSLCGTVNDKGFYHAYTLFLHLGKVATTDRCYDCACIIYIYIYIYIYFDFFFELGQFENALEGW